MLSKLIHTYKNTIDILIPIKNQIFKLRKYVECLCDILLFRTFLKC